MSEVIEFQTIPFKHKVSCYPKGDNQWDVYLDKTMIMQAADLEWIKTFRNLFKKKQ